MKMVEDPLNELSNAISAVVKQQLDISDVLKGEEIKNRYHVYIKTINKEITYLFKGREETSFCYKNCIK